MIYSAEDTNYIAADTLKDQTLQNLIDQVKKSDSLITFGVAEKLEDDVVTVGAFEPIFTLSPDTDKANDELIIECQVYVSDARKYYGDVIDVALLHESIRETAAQKQLSVLKDDYQPAFYNTYVYFELNASRNESVKNFLSRLKEESSKIYLDGKRKAIDVQIQTLKEYKETI